MSERPPTPAEIRAKWEATVNWHRLGARLTEELADMIHREDTGLRGSGLYGEALRRVVTNPMSGLTITAQAEYTRETHTIVDRTNRETAERELRECQEARRADQRTLARALAEGLRQINHQNNIKSVLRREGVEYAAKWLEEHR